MRTSRGRDSTHPFLRRIEEGKPAAVWGLMARREGWRLTWRGRFAVLLTLAALGALFVLKAHDFLAVTDRVQSDVLVIEGWSEPSAMPQVAAEYRTGHYRRAILLRTIGNMDDKYLSGRDRGDYLLQLLVKYGIPPDRIAPLFPIVAGKDRTFHGALDLKRWMEQQHIDIAGFNLITMGPHARRSRLLYEKAFEGKVKVGIIAMESLSYDKAHWWRSSEGVRDVSDEVIAYIYARFLFHADQ